METSLNNKTFSVFSVKFSFGKFFLPFFFNYMKIESFHGNYFFSLFVFSNNEACLNIEDLNSSFIKLLFAKLIMQLELSEHFFL